MPLHLLAALDPPAVGRLLMAVGIMTILWGTVDYTMGLTRVSGRSGPIAEVLRADPQPAPVQWTVVLVTLCGFLTIFAGATLPLGTR